MELSAELYVKDTPELPCDKTRTFAALKPMRAERSMLCRIRVAPRCISRPLFESKDGFLFLYERNEY